ncbi:CRISPR-associated endonuclease Cas2 [Candidatus Nomurabacteria bacterium RIFCSPHIGHO2_02_FULL_38_15]|uniref:CRISPR-associated endonuclease Cas2 n=1 Tax=Candidatus Nomurabacteria bacterium RIFCSPHIGHO2_02_FULL_38_15 TaxID=1801752 RepID=A0A1F6VQJ6_9BACT|nr:MAG: CRISPR-associated endonuclease Cas2 [Candidatus Nomurabacteria bacterium RIFCSPHIGHO2_02_FULL_38_15]
MKAPYWERATYTDEIISYFLSCRSMHLQSKALKILVEKREKREQRAFLQSLYRLRKQGFVKATKDDLVFDYKKYMQDKGTSIYFKKEKSLEGVIVMFDIPEVKKKTRDWLRNQLKLWGFVMIQQSVWFGKGRLTKDFKVHLDFLGIKTCVKIFNASQIKV